MVLGTYYHGDRDLLSWVLWHVGLGIDHVVVYHSTSDLSVRDQTGELAELGWITLVPLEPSPYQLERLACARLHREWSPHCEWMLCLDADYMLEGTTGEDTFDMGSDDDVVGKFTRNSLQSAGVLLLDASSAERPTAYSPKSTLPALAYQTRHLRIDSGDTSRPPLAKGFEISDASDLQRLDTGAVHISVTPYPAADEDIPAWVRRVRAHQEQRYRPFHAADFTLSVRSPSWWSGGAALSDSLVPGTTLVLHARDAHPGFVEAFLTSPTTKHYLPSRWLDGGDLAFDVPATIPAAEATLDVRQAYTDAISPALDPPTPCHIMQHLLNQPKRKQLLSLQAGICQGILPAEAHQKTTLLWPRSLLRDNIIFQRSLSITAASRERPVANSALAAGTGGWIRHTYASQASPPVSDTSTRLHVPERCPMTPAAYWSMCGNETTYAAAGIYRWTPAGATSYRDVALPGDEIHGCLIDQARRKKRILIVGDSVASHTFVATSCLIHLVQSSAAPGAAPLQKDDHVRFRSFQYDVFDVVGSAMTRSDWLDVLSWTNAEGHAPSAFHMPNVVMINTGLWAVAYTSIGDYETGLRLAAQHLNSIAEEYDMRIIWRETTAAFPRIFDGDPGYLTNPRIEVINRIAREIFLPEGGGGRVEWLPAYEMTRSRSDQARDNVHMCPLVQGDLAEALMHKICRTNT
ncbi:hypothetical protein JCM10908_007020 [Rhodotorula pacifica]|uniref:uncharacterized protein n=1 Tax=Rhodotorula pacifica TaxID=1495444 RepID=UPI00317ADE17